MCLYVYMHACVNTGMYIYACLYTYRRIIMNGYDNAEDFLQNEQLINTSVSLSTTIQ